MRKYTLLVVVCALAGTAWGVRSAAQAPADPGNQPVRGAWTPHVIATARPVKEGEPANPPAVPSIRPQPPDVPPIAKSAAPPATPATPLPPVEPVRLVSGQGPRAAPASAPAGACLVVERAAPATAVAGKPFTYEIVVRNVGGAEAQRVHVEERLPASVTVSGAEPRAEMSGTTLLWDFASLAAGAEARLRVALQPPPEGDIASVATATCAATSTLHARVVRPGLSLTVATPPPARLGAGVTFTLQITNNAPAALQNIQLRARLADGLRHPAGGQLEAVIPALAAGELKSVPLEVVAAKPGRLVLAATVTAAGADSGSGEAAVEVTDTSAASPAPAPSPQLPERKAPDAPGSTPDPLPLPPLPPPGGTSRLESRAAPPPAVTFTVVDADQALEVGRETTYEIRVLNQGAAPARDVLVQAVVPDEMDFVRAEGPPGRAVHVLGRQVAFEPLANLSGRGEAVYRVRAKARKPGDGRFTARLQCEAMTRPLSQEVSTPVYSDEVIAGPSAKK